MPPPPQSRSTRKNTSSSNVSSKLKFQLKQFFQFSFYKDLLFNPNKSSYVMFGLFVVEIFLNVFIIKKTKYTEIDWIAYMQEVEGVVNGTFDYYELKGDTGPLVYVSSSCTPKRTRRSLSLA